MLKGSIEKVISNNSILSNILDKLNLGEITSIAIDVIGNLATPAIILYSNIDNLVDIIKDNKLEDEQKMLAEKYKFAQEYFLL